MVFKIVPMEGSIPVNGEQQKCAANILAEVDISLRLSRLRGEPGGPMLCVPPDAAELLAVQPQTGTRPSIVAATATVL